MHTKSVTNTDTRSTVDTVKLKKTPEVENPCVGDNRSCYWSGMMELTAGCKSTLQWDRKYERERKSKNESTDEKDRRLWSIPYSSKSSFSFRLSLVWCLIMTDRKNYSLSRLSAEHARPLIHCVRLLSTAISVFLLCLCVCWFLEVLGSEWCVYSFFSWTNFLAFILL